jgi:hypothetical protein
MHQFDERFCDFGSHGIPDVKRVPLKAQLLHQALYTFKKNYQLSRMPIIEQCFVLATVKHIQDCADASCAV